MTYEEWQKAGGIGVPDSMRSTYCASKGMHVMDFYQVDVGDLIASKFGYFQRFFVGAILIHPKEVSKKIRDEVFVLTLAQYEQGGDTYYDPRKKASEIYGKSVAATWDVD